MTAYVYLHKSFLEEQVLSVNCILQVCDLSISALILQLEASDLCFQASRLCCTETGSQSGKLIGLHSVLHAHF